MTPHPRDKPVLDDRHERVKAILAEVRQSTCVSRTTLSAGSADGLVDDGGDRLVPQRAGPLPGAFDHGVELLIGQRFERAIDLFEARARGQEEGEDLLRQCLALGLRGASISAMSD